MTKIPEHIQKKIDDGLSSYRMKYDYNRDTNVFSPWSYRDGAEFGYHLAMDEVEKSHVTKEEYIKISNAFTKALDIAIESPLIDVRTIKHLCEIYNEAEIIPMNEARNKEGFRDE